MIGHYNKEILSEKEKQSEDYLTSCIDQAIAELVVEKDYLRKAYNYYNGQRDKEQYKFLEENFNIGNPTSVEFIPLIRRHVDALVGEHLQNKLKPKITCKDQKTLSQIERQKQIEIYTAEVDRIKHQLHNNLLYHIQSDEEKQQGLPPEDKAAESELVKLKDQIGRNFVSEFEMAAQHVLTHLIQSKSVDLYSKLKILFLDILIAGQCYYKVNVRRLGETPDIEVLNPFDVFSDRNQNSPYVKTRPRVVVRRWMYKDQVLAKYGEHFGKDDIDELESINTGDTGVSSMQYIRGGQSGEIIGNSSWGAAFEGRSEFGEPQDDWNLIPVYEVEWLTTNPVKVGDKTIYRTDRYSGVRIGESIYLDMGKDEDTMRSVEDPYNTFNSTNGVFYSDRNGKPYSLVLSTANLQDKYDVLHFYRDVLIANSGVKGDFLDTSQLPTFLGKSPAERIMKWKAYKKQGVALVNTAQEGRGANHNTIYGGFDDTVPGQAIQAIQFAIQQTEETCSAITGVFRERLGAIESKDAVSNVEVGIKQSAVITKQYYQLMDSITTELLIDSLNACKESYKEGMVGSIILGNKMQKIFTIQPEHFSFTDFDVHIADSGDIIRDMQKIEAITMELIKGGLVDIDVVLEGVTTESLTEMKEELLAATARKKAENNTVGQLQQQLQQIQNQLQQVTQEAQKVAQENEMLKNASKELEAKRIQNDYDVRKEANRNARDFNNKKLELDGKRIQLEALQLQDNDTSNDEIKNV